MTLARRSLTCLTLMAGLLIFGCAHYQAGDGSTIPFSSIQINPVINQSLAPQANQVLNHDLREAFIQSGKLTLVGSGADTELTVTITHYGRETIATNSRDTGLARKYTLSLTASCELRSSGEATPYFSERELTVETEIFLDSGQTRAETHAIPLLSKKLANAISNEVLQVW